MGCDTDQNGKNIHSLRNRRSTGVLNCISSSQQAEVKGHNPDIVHMVGKETYNEQSTAGTPPPPPPPPPKKKKKKRKKEKENEVGSIHRESENTANNSRILEMFLFFLEIPPGKTHSSRRAGRIATKSCKGLSIDTCNIEGAKTNTPFLQQLCKDNDIICMQEHWLWECQNHEMRLLVTNKDFFIRSSDFNETI